MESHTQEETVLRNKQLLNPLETRVLVSPRMPLASNCWEHRLPLGISPCREIHSAMNERFTRAVKSLGKQRSYSGVRGKRQIYLRKQAFEKTGKPYRTNLAHPTVFASASHGICHSWVPGFTQNALPPERRTKQHYNLCAKKIITPHNSSVHTL